MKTRLMLFVLLAANLPGLLQAQLGRQSELTTGDVDYEFKLTVEHLALNSRWLGVAPREVRWAPDGSEVYFRWREDPKHDQLAETDPWYAVDRRGRTLRQLSPTEVQRLPDANLQWSGDRERAAWILQGTLFVWSRPAGTRPVYTASTLGRLQMSFDGSRVLFATQGLASNGLRRGDRWSYEFDSGHVRKLAEVVDKDDKEAKKTEAGKWIQAEELALIQTVEKRKRDRETRQALQRQRQPFRPQEIPISKDEQAYGLQLSPDGRFVTFLWSKDPSSEHRTQYLEVINEDGYAVAKDARPKVGEPLPEYKMGIVKVDPARDPQEVEIQWVDDGIDRPTIIHGPYWNPQGTHALVQILSLDHKDRWIALLDLENGQVKVLDHQHEDTWIGGPLVGGRWRPGFLQWLPEGDAFGFFSTASGWSMLYLGHADGRIQQLTDGSWEVRDAELSGDGKSWHLTTSREHPGEEQFYLLPARGGQLVRITQSEGKHRVAVSPDGRRLALLSVNEHSLPDLYLLGNEPGATPIQITKSGTDEFYRYAWVDSEIVSFPDAGGNETWARVWNPPTEANRAAVVYAHGCGECAQAVDKGWTRISARLYANFLHQRGYTAASIDYRGSSGYGHRNRTYAFRQMGISDIDSGLALLDILVERYRVDRRRIGVYGGSYGGFFTIMSLLRNPGRYAAGVALYPVTDWAHYNHGYTSRILNGSPASDPEAYRQSSPVYYADNLQDALQIQHGLVDPNVQVQDSFRLAQILTEKKKEFDLVVYPMEDHGWDEVSTRRDSFRRMTNWFDRYLLADEPNPMTSSAGQFQP